MIGPSFPYSHGFHNQIDLLVHIYSGFVDIRVLCDGFIVYEGVQVL